MKNSYESTEQSRPMYRSELPLWQVLVPRKVLAAGAIGLFAAGVTYGVANKVQSTSDQNNLVLQLEHPLPKVESAIKTGNIDQRSIAKVNAPTTGLAWTEAVTVVGNSADPREVSDIISAQVGDEVTRRQPLELPKADLPGNQ